MGNSAPREPDDLVRRFAGEGVQALALFGSHARGDAGPWSDVDVVRFLAANAPAWEVETHLLADRLVVVSSVTPAAVESWFTAPEEATHAIVGLRQAQALFDPAGVFAALQARAHAFTWDAAMQTRADQWAGRQMVGWIEEAHKGLEGLRRGDVGRLLQARHGLSWGMLRVLIVQHGIVLASENDLLAALATAMAREDALLDLLTAAFGMAGVDGTPPSLRAQVIAGLQVYVQIAEHLAPHLAPDAAALIMHVAEHIRTSIFVEP